MGFYVGAVDQRHADRRREHRPHRGGRLRLCRHQPRRHRRRRTTSSAARKAPSRPRSRAVRLCVATRHQGRAALHADAGQRTRPADALLELMDAEGVDKFYLSHLNYGGRGNLAPRRRRDFTVDAPSAWICCSTRGLRRCRSRPRPRVRHRQQRCRRRLSAALGAGALPGAARRICARSSCSGAATPRASTSPTSTTSATSTPTPSGGTTASGNVQERPFSEIWRDLSDPLMAGLKQRPRPVTGRCGACAHLDDLQRQHARARAADHRRPVGGRSGLLSRRRGDRAERAARAPRGDAVSTARGRRRSGVRRACARERATAVVIVADRVSL